MAVREEATTRLNPGRTHLIRSVVSHVRDTRVVIESSTWVQRHEERICSSLSTVSHSLFGPDGVLESLVNLNLNASLSLLLLRTISTDDLLGLGEIGSDGL